MTVCLQATVSRSAAEAKRLAIPWVATELSNLLSLSFAQAIGIRRMGMELTAPRRLALGANNGIRNGNEGSFELRISARNQRFHRWTSMRWRTRELIDSFRSPIANNGGGKKKSSYLEIQYLLSHRYSSRVNRNYSGSKLANFRVFRPHFRLPVSTHRRVLSTSRQKQAEISISSWSVGARKLEPPHRNRVTSSRWRWKSRLALEVIVFFHWFNSAQWSRSYDVPQKS